MKNVKGGIEVSGMNMRQIVIDGDVLGGFGHETKKKFFQEFLEGISYQNSELFPEIAKQTIPIQSNEPDAATKIKQLKELFDQELITEEEFNSKKSELLKEM